MKWLRLFLFPFALIYGLIMSFRNFLFDKGLLKSQEFDLPVIAVGNLSVGGTGKTPQIEYLIRLLSKHYRVATLSRGYKRKSKGFLLADVTTNAALLGDEPFQYYQKFPEIQVAVDESRVHGIQQFLKQDSVPEVVLLDDAFQHRYVKAGFYILLTTYHDLYVHDFVLPMGNLREFRKGSKRADVIVVTKCPDTCDATSMAAIKAKLDPKFGQEVFFTSIKYAAEIFNTSQALPLATIANNSKLIVAGIANPTPFIDFIKNPEDDVLIFPDHHHFTASDLESIQTKAAGRLIITTEKDFVRLSEGLTLEKLYYLPIESAFITDQTTFDSKILDYVGKNTRNG